MTGWDEVADGVFRRRYAPWDVTVGVVLGRDGLLLVDSRASPEQARELRDDLAGLSRSPVRRVVNTHAHFDHTFGNEVFAGLPIVGHERLPAQLGRDAPATGVLLTPPTELVRDAQSIDVGGREVRLWHPGRGHTDHDLVLNVPDAGAWLVGDLIEESGPPAYGPDAFPLDWPGTAAALLACLGDGDVVVPGHGGSVDRAFVARQRADLTTVAELIQALHAAGVPAADALRAGGERWPFPGVGLVDAVAAGYAAVEGRARSR